MTERLKDRIALVTGASRGIGRAVALRLAEEGATVVAVARTQGALEELDDEIKARTGRNAVLVAEDLRQGDKIDQVGAALYQRFGRLDVLVGNAGTLGMLAPIGHVGIKQFDECMATNVTANWRLIRSMDPLLRASDAGRAVFVTDGVARRDGHPYWGPYAASKAALEVLVKTWAHEIEKVSKVRVNLIDPVRVRTRLRTSAFPGENPETVPLPETVVGAFVDLLVPEVDFTGRIVTLGEGGAAG
ncbi:MAG: SDR family NAD(P)-dependent oxidoreductase [Caenispirillum sp.]|nr:SDR family NAD(P)-dependent oxidoreductase [Caenispirillum sp.]